MVVDSSGTGAVTGGGGSATTGGGGSFTTTTGSCPGSQPDPGTSCALEGEACSYGSTCCPISYACTGGVWVLLATGGCGTAPCPTAAPTEGTSCDPCGPTTCTYDCPGFSVTFDITCPASGVWTLTGPCPG